VLSRAVTTRLDRVFAVPADTRHNAMMLRIQAFIGDHLADPGLSPAMIAAAHYISVRTLHKLFEAHEQTITATIRRRRLERCRHDLLDPALGHHPVSAIGARWGFQDPAAFSRAFHTAYGIPPGAYRAIQLSTGATPGQKAKGHRNPSR
jgi:AraC-like DNA-binding protein